MPRRSVKRRQRRRLPPRQLQRAAWPAPPLSARVQLRLLGRRIGRRLRALDEHLVLALDPCARVCCCADPGRHLRRDRLLPQVPRLPSGWAILDRAGVLLGLLDRRRRWRSPQRLRAVRTVLLLIFLMSLEIAAAAVLSSYANAHRMAVTETLP